MASIPSVPRLALREVSKRYGQAWAVRNVSLEVGAGEIHALLGENGAGKSSLVKTIYGVLRADSGICEWEGKAVEITSPAAARRLGIGMVFQHFTLFESLSVAENIALALPERLNLDSLSTRLGALTVRYGLALDPARPVHSLSVGERQRVEILRCLLQSPRLLILDEPTSVLTPQAVVELFDTLRQLAAEGCSILYISHKLGEIQALCHRATVLRAGQVAGRVIPNRESAASLARLMIGHELPSYPRRRPPVDGQVRLEVRALSSRASDPFGCDLHQVSLTVRSGEILGIAGVSGNGQQELLAALDGETPLAPDRAACLQLDGRAAGALPVTQRRALGVSFVPEERLGRGSVGSLALTANALLTAHRQGMVRWAMIATRAVTQYTRRCIERFDVRCSGPDATAHSLSGGNLQKFLLGREILQRPRVLVAAQPTWGVDVGAAGEIRQALMTLAAEGTAVLIVSEDLDELLEVCDSIAVMARGRLSRALPATEVDADLLGVLMSGDDGVIPERPTHAL